MQKLSEASALGDLMKPIDSRQNPKIKLARALNSRKQREAQGLFLVEGLFHIGEALEAGANIEFALAAPGLLRSPFGRELLARLEATGIAVYQVESSLLNELSGRERSSGLIAVCQAAYQGLPQLPAAELRSLVAILAPQDPGNLGAVLRSADAFGLDGLLLLDGGVDAYHPSAVRAGMGVHFWKRIARASFADCVEWAKVNRFALVGSSAKEGTPLSQASVPRPFILLLGSERQGLSPQHKAACDHLLRIEMAGRATSLNLAVAAGVLMHGLLGDSSP